MRTLAISLLAFGGVLFWALVAFVVVRRTFRRVVRRRNIRAWLDSPAMFPYSRWLAFRWSGYFWRFLRAVRLIRKHAIAAEVVTAHSTTSLARMRELRDVML